MLSFLIHINEFDININFKNLQLHSTGTPETLIKINNDKNVFMTELLNFFEIKKTTKDGTTINTEQNIKPIMCTYDYEIQHCYLR